MVPTFFAVRQCRVCSCRRFLLLMLRVAGESSNQASINTDPLDLAGPHKAGKTMAMGKLRQLQTFRLFSASGAQQAATGSERVVGKAILLRVSSRQISLLDQKGLSETGHNRNEL